MSDGTVLSTNVGTGDTIATDDLGATGKVQWVKLMDGTNNSSAVIPGDATNGLDVDVTRLPAGTVAGAASLPAGTNAIGKLAANSGVDIGDVDVTSLPGQVADGAAGLPAVLYVVGGWDGTNVQALSTDSSGLLQVDVVTAPTTAVTGPLTDTQLRATPVPVSGTVTATTGGLTDTQLRATAVPVSGPLTDTQLRATPVPVSGTVNLGTAAVTNAGTFAVQNTAATPAGNNNIGDVDIASALPAGNNNIGDVDIASALPAGTNAIGKLAANSGVDIGDVDVTSISAGTNAIGNVGIIPRTTGGLTTFHAVSAASTNATNVKASAGQLFGWYIYNSNAAARKVAFHNTAGTPTAGASIFFTLVIPPTSAANVFSDVGIAFGTGIGISTVTGLADSDTAAVALNDLIINLWYA